MDRPRWSHWRRCARLDYLELRRTDWDLDEEGPINGWQVVGGSEARFVMRGANWFALGTRHVLQWEDVFGVQREVVVDGCR